MIGLFKAEVRRQRIGSSSDEASEPSRRGVAANALRAGFPLVGFSRRDEALLKISSASRVLGLTHPTWIRFPQLSNQQVGKINFPFVSAHPIQSHRIPNKGFPHKPFSPSPSDLPVGAHPAHLPALPIAQHPTARRCWLGTINLRWSSLPQSFVRSDLVVGLYPPVHAPLLGPQVGRNRARRLGLEHPMHLFVSPILFWMARPDEFDPNPQNRPPGTQARKPDRTLGSKGSAVVHTNNTGVPFLSEQAQENPPGLPPTLSREQTDTQQITAEQISYRQRFYTLAVCCPKPTFEIYGPYLIAPPSHRQFSSFELRPPGRTSELPHTQFQSIQPLANSPGTGSALSWIFFAQTGSQFPAAPTPAFSAQPANPTQPFRRDSPRRVVGLTSPVSQARGTFPLESPLPFVAALAAYPKTPTQLRHASLGRQCQFYEPQPSHHSGELFP